MNPLILKGQFYLPEQKAIKISGVLTFSHQNGIILELIGTFTNVPGYHQIILGHTTDGRIVSLYRNEAIKFNYGIGIPAATYKSRFLFIGINFDTQQDLRFRSLSCRFSVLNEWLFTENLIATVHNKDQKEAILQFKSPFSKSISLKNDLEIILEKFKTERIERSPHKITFEEVSRFRISFKRRVPLSQLLEPLKTFQNLLTFVTQRQVYPDEIRIDFRTKGSRHIHTTNLQYQIPNYQDSLKAAPMNHEFLFSYSLVPHKIESLVYNWFALGEKLALIMGEFCSQFYNPKMYQEDKFLSMTACLESFHREFRIKKKMANIDRYKSLFDESRSAFNWLLKIPSKNNFCKDLLDYRNDLTHNNPEKVLKTRNINKLYRLTGYSKVILVSVVLRELGLTNPEIKELFQKNTMFHRL